MWRRREKLSKGSSGVSASGEKDVPRGYKIAIGILLLSVVIVGLNAFEQANLLQLQNSELSSRASSLSNNVSDLYKIVGLEKSQVLADNNPLHWTLGSAEVPLNWYCECFQYSGYVRVNWTSSTDFSFRVVQFGLNFTTPSGKVGDFRISISRGEPFTASFVMAGCSVQAGCSATYSAVYHY
jgi:hypothetical protein